MNPNKPGLFAELELARDNNVYNYKQIEKLIIHFNKIVNTKKSLNTFLKIKRFNHEECFTKTELISILVLFKIAPHLLTIGKYTKIKEGIRLFNLE